MDWDTSEDTNLSWARLNIKLPCGFFFLDWKVHESLLLMQLVLLKNKYYKIGLPLEFRVLNMSHLIFLAAFPQF